MLSTYRKFQIVGGNYPPEDTNVVWYDYKTKILKYYREGVWEEIYVASSVSESVAKAKEAVLGLEDNVAKLVQLVSDSKDLCDTAESIVEQAIEAAKTADAKIEETKTYQQQLINNLDSKYKLLTNDEYIALRDAGKINDNTVYLIVEDDS